MMSSLPNKLRHAAVAIATVAVIAATSCAATAVTTEGEVPPPPTKVSNGNAPAVPVAQRRGASQPLYAPVVNPQIPLSINFAGQEVSLDRTDLYERLDRELTSLVFGHSNTLLTIKRANRFFPIMAPILKRNGVPLDFLYLACIESYLNLRAYSPAHAAGIWQFLAATGKQYGLEVNDEVDERYDPEKATEAACKYLKAGYNRYGDWTSVAASYNAGMGKISNELSAQQVKTALDLYLTEETSRYVLRIFAMKIVMEQPHAYGFYLDDSQLYQPITSKVVEVSGRVADWADWAKQHGMNYLQLRELNPWIRSKTLTNKSGKTYKVKVATQRDFKMSNRTFVTYNNNWITK